MSRILRMILAGLLISLLGTLAACTRPDSGTVLPSSRRQSSFQLQARIQQGPSAGLTLNGDLRVTIDSANRLQGTLTRETGSPITVTGQIDGLAIHWSFDLGDNTAVLGVGTLQHDIGNPQGTAGGLLTGPQPGDSGDWFARWTTIVTPTTPAQTKPAPNNNDLSPLSTLISYLAAFLIMMVAFIVYSLYKVSGSIANMPATFSKIWRAYTGQTRYPPSPFPRHSTIPSVQASAQTMEPERWPDEATLPLMQFATTYAHGDDHYDLSFAIKSARGEFLGECGAGISATSANGKSGMHAEAEPEAPRKMPSPDDALAFLTKLTAGKEEQLRRQAEQEGRTRTAENMGRTPTRAKTAARIESPTTQIYSSTHQAVTALEVWIFDKNDINTVTKVLRSAHASYTPTKRSPRNPVNEVLVIESDQMVVLETKTLRLRVKVLAVEYCGELAGTPGAFKQVSLKLAAWCK